mgnify:FL=1|tara:strand:- start:2778 stop:3449 length:672 start_codon:yes stop_codon:yes gene_type:complete
MLLQINKKILFYLFIFLLLGTFNNQKIYSLELPKITEIEIIGLDEDNNLQLLNELTFLKIYDLFFLKKEEIKEILDSINIIDKYFVTKKYPSSLKIEIFETKSLAYTKKKEKILILGSNGKFFVNEEKKLDIPFIFGNFEPENFFEFKKIIDQSKLPYSNIKKFYSFKSGRWDLEVSSGILIKLPDSEIKNALDLCFEILNDDKFKNVKIIDLRQTKRLITNE